MFKEGLKIILAGEAGTGKTSLMNCFLGLPFDQNILSTEKPTIKKKYVQLANGENIKLNICDTSNEEKFYGMLPNSLEYAAITFLCFSYSNVDSVNEWALNIYHTASHCNAFLVLTKSDLCKDSIDQLRSRVYAKGQEVNIHNCFITSAKNDVGVNELFEKAATFAARPPIFRKKNIYDLKFISSEQSMFEHRSKRIVAASIFPSPSSIPRSFDIQKLDEKIPDLWIQNAPRTNDGEVLLSEEQVKSLKEELIKERSNQLTAQYTIMMANFVDRFIEARKVKTSSQNCSSGTTP